jgi:hypothetical protein
MELPKTNPVEDVKALSPNTIVEIIKASLNSQQANVDKWSESLVSYLTLCNGGAATAALALLGASDAFRTALQLYAALGFFIVGLALVGCLWIAQGFRQQQYNRHLMAAVAELAAGNIDGTRPHLAAIAGEEIISNPGFIAARVSFYLFVGGCLSAGAAALHVL